MKRTMLIVCLTLVGLLAHARPASAGWWAWLEEFSGPGPFKGKYAFLGTVCFDGPAVGLSPFRNEKTSAKKVFCLYADEAAYRPKNNANPAFPRIDVGMQDFGGAVRVNNWLDLGAGVGRIGFKNNGVHSKLTWTPIRVVVRPLLLAHIENRKWRQVAGVLNVYVKETVVGPLSGSDFGVAPAAFSSGREVKTSAGLTLDLTALLGIFNR